MCSRACVFVCVCVRVREREKESERERALPVGVEPSTVLFKTRIASIWLSIILIPFSARLYTQLYRAGQPGYEGGRGPAALQADAPRLCRQERRDGGGAP